MQLPMTECATLTHLARNVERFASRPSIETALIRRCRKTRGQRGSQEHGEGPENISIAGAEQRPGVKVVQSHSLFGVISKEAFVNNRCTRGSCYRYR